jgi:hypothetical protein
MSMVTWLLKRRVGCKSKLPEHRHRVSWERSVDSRLSRLSDEARERSMNFGKIVSKKGHNFDAGRKRDFSEGWKYQRKKKRTVEFENHIPNRQVGSKGWANRR